jgi:hypothetical protein
MRMAQTLRFDAAGTLYPVINRGNCRQNVFGIEGAADAFEQLQMETCERFSWRLHAVGQLRAVVSKLKT